MLLICIYPMPLPRATCRPRCTNRNARSPALLETNGLLGQWIQLMIHVLWNQAVATLIIVDLSPCLHCGPHPAYAFKGNHNGFGLVKTLPKQTWSSELGVCCTKKGQRLESQVCWSLMTDCNWLSPCPLRRLNHRHFTQFHAILGFRLGVSGSSSCAAGLSGYRICSFHYLHASCQ